MFHGPVRVPETAVAGKAKVTFSFDAWAEGCVEPTTIELSVVAPKAKVKADDAAAE